MRHITFENVWKIAALVMLCLNLYAKAEFSTVDAVKEVNIKLDKLVTSSEVQEFRHKEIDKELADHEERLRKVEKTKS